MDIRRQELILFHEKSTLSPLSLPPRIPQPGVSPGFILLFLPPRLGISAMGFFLSPVEGALSYVAEGNLNNSICFVFLRGWVGSFLRLTIDLPVSPQPYLCLPQRNENIHSCIQTNLFGNVHQFTSVRFSHSVVSGSLQPHGLQHRRLPWSLVLTSIVSVMPSNHLILCRPLLLSPSVFPSIRVFTSESVSFASGGQSIGVSASISVLPLNIQD